MKKPKWIVFAVALCVTGLAGVAYASKHTSTTPTKAGYICPVTGEELPCPECCPYKDKSK